MKHLGQRTKLAERQNSLINLCWNGGTRHAMGPYPQGLKQHTLETKSAALPVLPGGFQGVRHTLL